MHAMNDAPAFLVQDASVGDTIRAFDWSRTALGPIDRWPPGLRAVVDLILHSPVPMVLLWGADGIMIYNDAYSVFAGNRHPQLLGSKVLEGWPEVADLNRQVMEVGLRGDALSFRSKHIVLNRFGRPEDIWVDLDYSPVFGESGRPEGVLAIVVDTTDKIRAESTLREREAELARVQKIGLIGGVEVFLTDGFRNRRSPEYLAIHGLPPEAAQETHEDWVRRIHPEDRAKTEQQFIDAVKNGARDYTAEYRIIRPSDGRVRWISVKAQIERDADGRPLRLIGAHIDVTDRKIAEEALRESEARFRLVAESAPVMLWMGDAQGKCLYLNRMLREFWGVAAEDVAAFDWAPTLHADDYAALGPIFSRAMQDHTPFTVEGRYRRADGEYRLLRTNAQPRFDANGTFLGMIGVNVDITEMKLAEQALEALVEARTKERDRIWNASQDLLVVANSSGTWLNVSPAIESTLGWKPSDVLGKTSQWLEHPDDQARSKAELVHLAGGGKTPHFENRLRTREGSYRWLSWTAASHEGLIYASARDVTDQKEAAVALKNTEEALRQSQKMEAVGQLTGGIAHDFNNLLQGIVGSLDVIQRRLADGRWTEVQRYVAGAMTAANRAAALTHRLLAFSRRQPLDPKPIKANPLIASMEDLLRRTMGEKIEMELVLAGGLWPTLCDHNQLENSVLNLAINARDAMPNGGKLTIETCNAHLDQRYAAEHAEVEPGQYICIGVTDTGMGMAPDIVERAFEPFFTTKPTGQGTGLGLSMIYGFARQSGGHVKIYSEVGRGTTVKLYLPRYWGRGIADIPEDQAVEDKADANGQTVLVVEDEVLVRMLVVEVLEEQGYRVLQASDGPAGLRVLQSPQPLDLLITDIGLPGLNGRQIADAALSTRPKLKVLFMTGYAENAAIANGVLSPGMQMITKPFAMDGLARRVRDLIHESR